MKIRGTLAALALSLGLGAWAFSQAPQPDAKRVDDLVKQLGSSKYVERERAQKELESIGGSALDALRKAAKEGDLEISRRAAEMVRRMEEKLTTGSLLAPKKVNLKLKDASVLDAVAELSKQSGYTVNIDGDRTVLANRKVTLETGETTFWEALDQLCARADLVERAGGVTGKPLPVRPVPLPIRPNPPIKVKPLPAPIQPVPQVQPGAPGAAAPGRAVPAIAEVQVQAQAQVQGQAQAEAPAQAQPAQAQPAQAKPIQAKAQVQVQILPAQIAPGAQGLVVAAPRPGVGPRTITLADGKTSKVPTCYSGAVRVRLLPPSQFNMTKQPGETLLVFDVAPEPRLQGFQLQGTPSITQAVDNQGQSLMVALDAPQANPNQPVAVGNVIMAAPFNPHMVGQIRPLPVRLKLGDKKADSLKELNGTLTALVQLPPEPLVVVENVLKSAGQTAKGKNGGSLNVQSIDKTGNNEYKVQMTIENMGQNPFNGNVQIIGNVQIQMAIGGGVVGNNQGMPELVDANGKAYQVTQIPARSMQINNGQIRQTVTVVYRANSGQGEPARLVINGTRTTSIAVPFAFKDVPLP